MSATESLGEFEQVVLLAILRLDGNAYGVSIGKELKLCAGRSTTPGALYTTLDRLQRKGWVKPRSGEATPERGGRAKTFYTVTSDGRTQLVAAQRAFQSLMRGLDLLGESNG